MEDFVSLYFVILALILLVVLVFLYRLTLAINRLDARIEQFARHLRDLNLYDLNVGGTGVLGSETEVEENSSDISPAGDSSPSLGDVTPPVSPAK
ncbi:MAG: hypothetical protein N3A66_02125 [Planctomycetota bacterium]|nr:hypothetical protein [Planctomycetota bacterium]